VAGLIPQSFINDLIDRVDIVDVIDGRVALKKTGKNYSGLCPFHDEKSPSFSVSPDKQFFHCFGCQESGTALTFLMKFERMEFVEAVETLAKDMGLVVPREKSNRPYVEVDQGIYDALEGAERIYRQQLRGAEVAVGYLKGRGLTGVTARDFGIGYAPEGWQNVSEKLLAEGATSDALLKAGLTIKNDSGRVYDRFRHRIMFPIRDVRGRVIGFGGRKMGDEEGPKYLNSPETTVFSKGRELYGLYEARKAVRNIDRLLVVEGYMDVAKRTTTSSTGIPMRSFVVLMAIKPGAQRPGVLWKVRCRS
jgi:DNA primase